MGITSFIPILAFFTLILCPESPVWQMTKGKTTEARRTIERLRGKDNTDIIDAEINRIELNIKIDAKEEQFLEKRKLWDILADPTFTKPFAILNLLFCVNLEWCGLGAVSFYYVPLLKYV